MCVLTFSTNLYEKLMSENNSPRYYQECT